MFQIANKVAQNMVQKDRNSGSGNQKTQGINCFDGFLNLGREPRFPKDVFLKPLGS